MTYATTNPPKLMATGVAGYGNLWHYSSADASATVDADGYITDGQDLGMKLNDSVIVVDTATPLTTFHRVTSLSESDRSVDLSNGTTVGATTDSD